MKKNQIEDISKELALSISLREDASQFINRLAVDIDKGPWKSAKFRAEVIGRTEVSRVQELARKQRANQLQREFPDVKMYQQWLAVPTSQQPCRTCFRYDGNVYDLEGNPILIGKDKAPGKRPDIPVHPNCRCTLIPYVPGMSQEPEDSSPPEDISEYPEIGEQVLVHWSDQLESWVVRFHPSRQIDSQSIRIPKSAPDESVNEEVIRLAKFWQIPHWNLNIIITRPQSMTKPIPIEGKSHIQVIFEKTPENKLLQEAAAPGTRWYGVPKSYHTWRGIKDRCLNKNNKDYPRYGGRGVKMDPGWQASYAIFLRDMGEPPEEGYSLDRIDNNGNYEKKNCKWVSKKEQAQNRSTSLKNRLPRIEVDKDPSTSTSKKFVKKSMPKIVPILADLHPSSQSQYKKK